MLNADSNYRPIVSASLMYRWQLCGRLLTYSLIESDLATSIAPMIDAVEYERVQFQNAFHHKSRYRGSPTPELEQAWLDLWSCELDKSVCFIVHIDTRLSEDTVGVINVPYDRLGELNKSEKVPWKRVSPENGGGVSALIDVFHQLHCLVCFCHRTFTYRSEYSFFPGRIFFVNTLIATSTITAIWLRLMPLSILSGLMSIIALRPFEST